MFLLSDTDMKARWAAVRPIHAQRSTNSSWDGPVLRPLLDFAEVCVCGGVIQTHTDPPLRVSWATKKGNKLCN